MRFPVIKGKGFLLSRPRCPQCGGRSTPGAFAVLDGGAMRVTNAKTGDAVMADDCAGFLDVVWHGGANDVDAMVSLAEDTPKGQFEFYFCSTKCLRAFLNTCVDELEKRVKAARHREIRKLTVRKRGSR